MKLKLSALAGLAAVLFSATGIAAAATVPIQNNQDRLNLADFDTDADVFQLHLGSFGITDGLNFTSLLDSTTDIGDLANLVIVVKTDDDNDLSTGFNARSALGVIADSTDTDRAGFFIYHNQGLSINRLVFTENLNDGSASIRILAAILDPVGNEAIARLSAFSAANFEAAPVPLPAALPLFASALAGAGVLRSRRKKAKAGAA